MPVNADKGKGKKRAQVRCYLPTFHARRENSRVLEGDRALCVLTNYFDSSVHLPQRHRHLIVTSSALRYGSSSTSLKNYCFFHLRSTKWTRQCLAMQHTRTMSGVHFEGNRPLKSGQYKPCVSYFLTILIPIGCRGLCMTSGDVSPISVVVYVCQNKSFQCLVEQIQDHQASDSGFSA